MQLTVVGSAGSVPGPDSACSCYLVEREGYRLVLELGTGAAGPLQRYTEAGAVDAVIMSHVHADHWSDLTAIGYLRTLAPHKPLVVVGPSDMPDVLVDNSNVFATTVADHRPGTLGPFTIRMSLVDHGECWAVRVDDTLCYTADTANCAALDDLAAGCAVLLAEASGFDADGPLRRHLTAGDAGRLAAGLAPSYSSSPTSDRGTIMKRLLREASAVADCPVLLAQPGLRMVV